MRTLSLDLGLQTGYAVRHGCIICGELQLQGKRFEAPGMRFVRFRNFLEAQHRAFGFHAIAYEEIAFIADRGGQSFQHQLFGGLLATMQVWADERGVLYAGYPPSKIKKHATGNGNARKDYMITAAKRILSAENMPAMFESQLFSAKSSISHNTADAICLLSLVEESGLC